MFDGLLHRQQLLQTRYPKGVCPRHRRVCGTQLDLFPSPSQCQAAQAPNHCSKVGPKERLRIRTTQPHPIRSPVVPRSGLVLPVCSSILRHLFAIVTTDDWDTLPFAYGKGVCQGCVGSSGPFLIAYQIVLDFVCTIWH